MLMNYFKNKFKYEVEKKRVVFERTEEMNQILERFKEGEIRDDNENNYYILLCKLINNTFPLNELSIDKSFIEQVKLYFNF